MINDFFIFAVSLYLVGKGAQMSTKYAARVAESFQLSKYMVGLIIVSIISILPETFIAINSAFEGIPSLGLGTLLGSNVADMTLIFAIIIFSAGRDLKIEGKILKNNVVYPAILLLPIVLGWNGHFSRMEGLALIIAGAVFYYTALKNKEEHDLPRDRRDMQYKSFPMLLLGMSVLLVGAHFTVTSATDLALAIGINPILIGIIVIGVGTTIPELFFSLRSVRTEDESLAVGDLLGTVLADATIVVGILAMISPFVFPREIIMVTGVCMVLASLVLFHFMKTGRSLTRREGAGLLLFWLFFVLVEFFVNA
jgi:cation:H+ antiporter